MSRSPAKTGGAPSGVHLWLVVAKAWRALQHVAADSIASTGLCYTDFAVLEALLHKGPLPVNVIGKKVLLTSGSMTVAVDRLAARGLVDRVADPGDRRARLVRLTAAGRALIAPAFRAHARAMEKPARGLSASERETLAALLKVLGTTAAGGPPAGATKAAPRAPRRAAKTSAR